MKNMDKNMVTNFKMMRDCEFYYRLLLGFTKVNNDNILTLCASTILRECTVFVREMVKYIPEMQAAIEDDYSKLFYKSYSLIRDRIHYFTSQPFNYENEKVAAENIIRAIQADFFTRPIDDMYSLRCDLSYIKIEDTISFCSIDVHSLLKDTSIEKNGRIIGPALKQYSADLASIISSIKQGSEEAGLEELISLSDLNVENKNFNLNIYNGKFDVAVERTGFSEFLTIILLRLLSDVGSLLFIVNKLFNQDWRNTYHLYYFTRLIAIRFDEISDAIYKIENGFPPDEATAFIECLKEKNIYPFPEELRQAARKLRNSIHYNPLSEIWNIDFSGKSFYWYNNFLQQASTSSSTLTSWPNDYLKLKERMLTHLALLYKWLAEIFDYNLELER